MGWSNLTAKFYNFEDPPVLQGTITQKIFEAGSTAERNRAGTGYLLLPETLTTAEKAYVVDGGLCYVSVTDTVGGSLPVASFVIEKQDLVFRNRVWYTRYSGAGILSELGDWRINDIISHRLTGNIVAVADESVTLEASHSAVDDYYVGWIVVANHGTAATQQGQYVSASTGAVLTLANGGWPLANPSVSDPYRVYGALPTTSDLDQLDEHFPTWWTLEKESGSHTGTAEGSIHKMLWMGQLGAATKIAEESLNQEWFRHKNDDPANGDFRTMVWRRTSDASGVELVDGSDSAQQQSASYGVIQRSPRRRRDYKIVTEAHPQGGEGLTTEGLTDAIYPLPTGFNFSGIRGRSITNTALVTAATAAGAKYHVNQFPDFNEIAPPLPADGTTVSATAILETQKQLAKRTVNWLRQRSGAREFFTIECVLHKNVYPGQTIDLSYDFPGENGGSISKTGLYIQSVSYKVSGKLATRLATLVLTETAWPEVNDRDTTTRLFRSHHALARERGNGNVIDSDITINNPQLGLGATAEAIMTISGDVLDMDLQAANTVLAAPDGALGSVGFRALVADDIPSLPYVPQTRSIATTSPLTGGGTLASDLTLGITLTASDVPVHDIISKHSYSGGGGAALDVVGLSDATTVAKLTPSANVTGGASSLLRSDTGKLSLAQLGVGTTPATNHGLTINKSWTDVDYASGAGVESTHSVENGYQTGYAYLVTGIMSVNSGTASALQANFTQSLFGGGGGTLGSLVGTFSRNGIINASPTGTITNSTGFQIDSFANLASGTPSVSITNATGLQIRNQGAMPGGVTVDTAIGLDIYTQTGASSSNLALRTGAGHVIFNNATDANTYMWVYGDDGNPAMIVRDRKVAIGGLWAANEALEVNGNVRLTGTGSTATVNTGTGPLILDPATNVQLSGDGATPGTGAAIESDHFTSQSRGWRMTYGGDLDARYIYTDELRAEFFTAAVTQAFNGSLVLTKSVAELNESMTTVGDYITYSTEVALKVQDLAGWSGYAVFGEGDYVRMRHMDTSGGGLSFGDVWGTVHSYTDNSDGTQTWQWRQTYPTGSGGVGLSVPFGSQVLDYGESGDGIWKATTLDRGNSPYSQYSTWSAITDGKPVETVKARVGNLAGIAGVGGAYGIWAGQDPAGPRLVATDSGIEVHGGRISAYEGGDGGELRLRGIRLIVTHGGGTAYFETDGDNETSARWTNSSTETAHDQVQLAGLSTSKYAYNPENTSGYIWFDMENTPVGFNAPTAVTAQANITNSSFTTDKCAIVVQVFQSDKVTPITSPLEIANETTATQDTWAFGWTDESVGYLEWNDAVLLVTWKYRIVSSTETIRLDPSVPSFALGNPLPTDHDAGDGVWAGLAADGYYKFRAGKAAGPHFKWDGIDAKLVDANGDNTIIFQSTGNARFEGVIEVGTGGGIWQGTGTFASPTTGLKIYNSGGIGVLEGYNAGTLQATFNSSGKLTAGGGVTTLDANGISVTTSTAYSTTRAYRFVDDSDNVFATLDAQVPNPALENNVRLRAHSITGRDSNVKLEAEAPSGENASVRLSSAIGTDDAIRLEVHHDRIETDGHFNMQMISSTPSVPTDAIEANVYVKGGNLIIQYNDGGTIRYKYLDLSGTGVTWVHTTTAP